MTPVKIYTTDYCGFCHRAKAFFEKRGIPYEEIDVTGKDEMRTRLIEMSGGQRTVPQIWIGDQHVGGYTDLVALDQRGGLALLLVNAGASPARSP